jgi:hypothetical protein
VVRSGTSAAVAVFWLGACTLERPPGAFDPVYDSGEDREIEDYEMQEASVPVPGTGGGFYRDAGAKPNPTGDGGSNSEPDPVDRSLSELIGPYWFRIDHYTSSTQSISRPPAPTLTVSIRNRTSYMGVALIDQGANGLVSFERICQQTFAHRCVTGCVNGDTKTTVHPNALAMLNDVEPTMRVLTLDQAAMQLKGQAHSFALGYKGTEDMSLPQSPTDARVWDTHPLQQGLEGFDTQAIVAVTQLGITRTAGCQMNLVLKFQNNWSIPLKKSGEVFQMDGPGTASLTGTDSKVLRATGSGEASDADCMGNDDPDATMDLRTQIRFLKVTPQDIERVCPKISEFDQRLPAEAP